jgi:CyaY protein
MDEREFNILADATLHRIEDAVEQCGAEVDVEIAAGGVLELELADGSKIIVNRHVAAREIWVAARSGGYHFRFEGGRWLGTRDGEELFAALARCLSEQSGERVALIEVRRSPT